MIEWQPRLDEMGMILEVLDSARDGTQWRKLVAGLLTFVSGWKRDLEGMESLEGFWNEFKNEGGIDALNKLDEIAQNVMCHVLTGRKGVKQAEPYAVQLRSAYRRAEEQLEAQLKAKENVDA